MCSPKNQIAGCLVETIVGAKRVDPIGAGIDHVDRTVRLDIDCEACPVVPPGSRDAKETVDVIVSSRMSCSR